ncbi:MAG: sigma factor-like helix-turn-helix DNA-binding protein [Patescibacteria group bacterium]
MTKKTTFSKDVSRKIEKAINYLTNPRVREVVERRFGLKNGKTETLEAIGQDHGITRERVRQLEENGLKILKSEKVLPLFDAAFDFLNELFAEHGHIMGEDYLYLMATGTKELRHTRGQVYLSLTIGDPFKRIVKDDKFHPYWISHETAKDKAKKIVDFLIDHFKKHNKVFHETEIMDLLSKKHSNIPPKMFGVVLEIARDINKNIFGEIGLSFWPEITPQGVKDRAYLLLKKDGNPKHFTAITELINKTFVDRPAYTQTVHNELIKDPRFILIGRGTYALGEWGYESGTVEDVIQKILSESKKPLSKKEIIDLVLEKRQVRPNTIILNLHRSTKVKRVEDGKYVVA